MPKEPLANRPDPKNPRGGDPVTIAKLREQLNAATSTNKDLTSRLKATSTQLDGLQKQYADQQKTVGSLTAENKALNQQLASTGQQLTDARKQLSDALSQIQTQVKGQVQDHLADVTKALNDKITALTTERDQLKERVSELEAAGADESSPPSMTTTDFAKHFAGVLQQMADQPSTSGADVAAAVTGFSVEAKGLLRATATGDVELVTPAAGAAPASQLSTLKMDVRLLPHLGGSTGQPPPS